MPWYQKEISISSKSRGFHLITDEILSKVNEIKNISIGIANIFIKHTSASIALNENVSPDVRSDLEKHFNKMVPENMPYYDHTLEGSDDMPAHIKNVLIGNSLTVPIKNGRFNFGTWQGIYLCEHRDYGGSRKIVITIFGEE